MKMGHVYPGDDLIAHVLDDTGQCICGPTVVRVRNDVGLPEMVATHHSLDGREHRMPDDDVTGARWGRPRRM